MGGASGSFSDGRKETWHEVQERVFKDFHNRVGLEGDYKYTRIDVNPMTDLQHQHWCNITMQHEMQRAKHRDAVRRSNHRGALRSQARREREAEDEQRRRREAAEQQEREREREQEEKRRQIEIQRIAKRLEQEERQREQEELLRRRMEQERQREWEQRLVQQMQQGERKQREQPRKTVPAQQEKEAKANKEKNESEDANTCVVCLGDKKMYAYLECGHLATCESCTQMLLSLKKPCPLCRKPIIRALRIYT